MGLHDVAETHAVVFLSQIVEIIPPVVQWVIDRDWGQAQTFQALSGTNLVGLATLIEFVVAPQLVTKLGTQFDVHLEQPIEVVDLLRRQRQSLIHRGVVGTLVDVGQEENARVQERVASRFQ